MSTCLSCLSSKRRSLAIVKGSLNTSWKLLGAEFDSTIAENTSEQIFFHQTPVTISPSKFFSFSVEDVFCRTYRQVSLFRKGLARTKPNHDAPAWNPGRVVSRAGKIFILAFFASSFVRVRQKYIIRTFDPLSRSLFPHLLLLKTELTLNFS